MFYKKQPFEDRIWQTSSPLGYPHVRHVSRSNPPTYAKYHGSN